MEFVIKLFYKIRGNIKGLHKKVVITQKQVRHSKQKD